MKEIELGPEQVRIMRVLWDKERATAQEIRDILNESEPTKLINVQVLLKRMVDKGAVAYDVDNRTYIYYPIVSSRNIVQHAVKKFADHMFGGSIDNMVSFIIKNESISPEILIEIRDLLDKNKKS